MAAVIGIGVVGVRSIAGMIRATEQILALAGENTQIIPGHGSLSNRTELEAYRQMLVDVRIRTQTAISQGLTWEEFLASTLQLTTMPPGARAF